jgi:pyruvate/2-oxoglutarate/acetoin dehydrogenase E1 component
MKEMLTFRDALAHGIRDEMRIDPSVFIYGLDVPDHKRIYGSTVGILEEFGEKRCFGTPLSEDAMTGVALGAAISGLKPIHVHIRTDFMLLGMNQIVNMISNAHYMSNGKLKVPLVIRAVIGRGWGQGAQHSKSLHGFFAHIPGLKVIMPTTPQDAYSLIRTSIQDPNPVIFLEHRWFYDIVGEVERKKELPLSQALVRKEGKDLTLICTSWMTIEALKVAEVLERQGFSIEVVDVRSIYPLDTQTLIHSVKKTRNCMVLDYDWVFAGFSGEIASVIYETCFEDLEGPIERIGFVHAPCPTTRPLENKFFPSAPEIIRKIEKKYRLKESDLTQDEFYTYESRFKGPF